jgi:hypothetical protein
MVQPKKTYVGEVIAALICISIALWSIITCNNSNEINKKGIHYNEYAKYYEYNVFDHSYYDVRTQEVSYQIDTIPVDTIVIKIK